jgi:hypothetical protein
MIQKTIFMFIMYIIILNGQEINNLTYSLESYYDSSINDITFEELNNEELIY